jgi:hypothetical protein
MGPETAPSAHSIPWVPQGPLILRIPTVTSFGLLGGKGAMWWEGQAGSLSLWPWVGWVGLWRGWVRVGLRHGSD